MRIFKNNKIEYTCIITGLILFWALHFIVTDNINSNFHLQDDWQILKINQDLKQGGENIFSVAGHWITNDYQYRFRPLYYFVRVCVTKLLGDNFVLWYFYSLILAILTSFLFYLFLRRIKFSILESVLFLLLSFVGLQIEMYYRLGTQEPIGLFFLSLALLTLLKSIKSNKPYCLLLYILLVILMSLSKESFIIIIPALIAVHYVLNKQVNPGAVKLNKSYLLTSSALAITMAVELIFILVYVGTNKIYAGIDKNTVQTGNLISTTIEYFSFGFTGLITFISFVLLVIMSKSLKKITAPVIICFLITAPQIILYAKSGIVAPRYLFPGITGFTFFIIFTLRTIRENDFSIDLTGFTSGIKKAKVYFIFAGLLICAVIFFNILVKYGFVHVSNAGIFENKLTAIIFHRIFRLAYLSMPYLVIILLLSVIIYFRKKLDYGFLIIILFVIIIYNYHSSYKDSVFWSVRGKNTHEFITGLSGYGENKKILIVANPSWNMDDMVSMQVYFNIVRHSSRLYICDICKLVNEINNQDCRCYRQDDYYFEIIRKKIIDLPVNFSDYKCIAVTSYAIPYFYDYFRKELTKYDFKTRKVNEYIILDDIKNK